VTREEILAGIGAVAREHLDIERTIGLDERLVEELGLDSIRLLTLAAEVENRFEIALDPEDEAGIRTVGDLLDAVERKLAARGH
jgi:acyl carrier protein